MAYCNNIVYSNCIGRVGIGLGNASPTEILEINGALKSNTFAQNWNYCATFIDRNVDATRIVAGAAGVQSSCITFHTYNAGTHDCRMVIKNDGKVGIGTAVPSALIHAEAADGTAGGAIKYTASSVASAYLSASPDGAVLATDTAGIVFRTGITGNDPTDTGSTVMTILSGGNIGIGTDSPTGLLNLMADGATPYAGTSDVLLDLKRGVTNTGSGNATSIRLANNSNGFRISYGGAADHLQFIDGGNSAVMTILNVNNRVGIGTSSPDYSLHVQSDIEANIKIETNNDGASNFAGLRMFKSRGTNASPTTVANGDTVSQILFYPRDASGWNNTSRIYAKICGTVTATDTPTDLVFSTGTTSLSDILFIKSGGNVGIGDPTPAYRLEVKDANTTSTAIQAKNTTGNDAAIQIAATSNTYSAHGVGASEAWLVDETGNALNIGPPSSKNTPIKFVQNGAVIGKWDAGGAFGIGAYGTNSLRTNQFFTSNNCSKAQIEGTGFNTSSLQIISNSTTEYPVLGLSRSRGTTIGSHTLVANDDNLGSVVFFASDGVDGFTQGAGVTGRINNANPTVTIASNQIPVDLVFSINDGGTGCGVSNVGRFSHAGNFLVGCNLACGNGMITALEKSGYGVLEARATTDFGDGGGGVIVTRAVDCNSTNWAIGCHTAHSHKFHTNGTTIAMCLNESAKLCVAGEICSSTCIRANNCVVAPTVCGSTLMKGCVICGYRTGTGLVGGLRIERCDTVGGKTTCFLVQINPDNNCVVLVAGCASQSGILCSTQTFRAPVMYTNDCFCTPGCVHASFYCSTGDITAAGDITSSSDCRLKSEIEVIDCAILIVNNLCGRRYVKDNKRTIGVIAQEVEKVLPEVVFTNESKDEYKSVSYGNIVAVLIEAIKEQDKRINELEKLIGK